MPRSCEPYNLEMIMEGKTRNTRQSCRGKGSTATTQCAFLFLTPTTHMLPRPPYQAPSGVVLQLQLVVAVIVGVAFRLVIVVVVACLLLIVVVVASRHIVFVVEVVSLPIGVAVAAFRLEVVLVSGVCLLIVEVVARSTAPLLLEGSHRRFNFGVARGAGGPAVTPTRHDVALPGAPPGTGVHDEIVQHPLALGVLVRAHGEALVVESLRAADRLPLRLDASAGGHLALATPERVDETVELGDGGDGRCGGLLGVARVAPGTSPSTL
mmetsp:Transcript_59970/g.137489  ORF Transcript_59970/g.137489 Transcript_59970/m.137489 type:complete len:267 (-) Transcript_59970:235-1035(-)